MTRRDRNIWKRTPHGRHFGLGEGELVCSDALHFLAALRDQNANIVFLDPPFNLGKRYGKASSSSDRMEDDDYFHYMSKILRRSCEILKEGGALYLYHVPRWAVRFAEVLRQEGMEFRHWIAIAMKNGFVRGRRLYPAHYGLLYFTKHEPRVFRRPKIPVSKCRHCGKEIKDYGGYKKYVRNGVNLSDVWDDISPVRHTKRKTRTSNELPQEILRRVLRISGRKAGLLVDPFAGSGTALVAAKAIGMRFVGCDREAKYCALMKRRLSTERKGP